MNEKTITIKKIPFPTWEEFDRGKQFNRHLGGEYTADIAFYRIISKGETVHQNRIRAGLEVCDEYAYCAEAFPSTQQGYTEACEFLQAEWEKLIESMANLGSE